MWRSKAGRVSRRQQPIWLLSAMEHCLFGSERRSEDEFYTGCSRGKLYEERLYSQRVDSRAWQSERDTAFPFAKRLGLLETHCEDADDFEASESVTIREADAV
jgi:hypothetical protein